MAREDVASKADCGGNGIAHRPVTVEQIVEEVPVDQIHLGAERYVAGEVPVNATAKAIEALPVGLFAGGRELMRNADGKGIGGIGMRRGRLVDGAKRWGKEKRKPVPMTGV